MPFEALTLPKAGTLLVERFAVSYLPIGRLRAAATGDRTPLGVALAARARRLRRSRARRVVSARNGPVAAAALRRGGSAATSPARCAAADEIHLGADARKQFVTDGRLRAVPVVHFSTHAVADTRDPDRSRILLAPRTPGGPADYLFLRDVDDLDLTGVGLVTLSACETARGKVVRGEGVEGFSRALLAAGAAAAVTTLWDVADRPSAELMTQFYASASGGRGTAEALRRGQADSSCTRSSRGRTRTIGPATC